jgi:UDP-2,4-diacetamido-2,4,6-trideoxy-beta-L-altropyranose hydrolase
MISMGGSDPHNITKKVAMLISDIDTNVKLNIVLGKFYKFKNFLIRSVLKSSIKFKIYDDQKNLKSLMLKNDLLITNSGITKYEAFATKLPSIIISNSVKSNQDQINFSNLGGSIFIGDFKSKKLNNLKKIILKLIKNKKIIGQMQKSCKNYFDGNGAKRILKIIDHEYKKNFRFN